MELTPEMVKAKIWVICSKATLVPDNSNLAGALCVHESGLLMTTIFGACPRTKYVSNDGVVRYLSKPEDFRVTAYDFMLNERHVELVHNCSEFGILFYQVVNVEDEGGYDYVNLDNVSQEQIPLKNLFAYLHHDWIKFSTLSAIDSYPSPPHDLTFEDDVSHSIVRGLTPSEITNLYYETMDCNPTYRMVENTVNIVACNKGNIGADGLPNPPDPDDTASESEDTLPPNPDDDILPEALQLYTKLPLLQFSGLGCDMYSGSSGCSVFKIENNELVGLILFNINSSCFAVPLSVLRHCFRKYKIGQMQRRGGKRGGGKGKKGQRRTQLRGIGSHG